MLIEAHFKQQCSHCENVYKEKSRNVDIAPPILMYSHPQPQKREGCQLTEYIVLQWTRSHRQKMCLLLSGLEH